MPLIGNDELVTIELPAAGEWVRVKRHQSKGDEVAVMRAAARGSTIVPGGEIELHGDELIEATTFAVLDVVLKQWSFVQPVTPENIRRLDAASVDRIVEQINVLDLYPGARSDDEKKGLPPSGATPSSDAEPPPPNSTASP